MLLHPTSLHFGRASFSTTGFFWFDWYPSKRALTPPQFATWKSSISVLTASVTRHFSVSEKSGEVLRNTIRLDAPFLGWLREK
jgi:hypothetical protein